MTTLDTLMAPLLAVQSQINANQPLVFSILGLLIAVHIINALMDYKLLVLGILPRIIPSLLGIFFAPILHGNINHLFFNLIPLFILTHLILLVVPEQFWFVTLGITIGAGLMTWLFGRAAIHVGASSVIMGYWGFLLSIAYAQPGVVSVILGFICVYYFGGFFFDVLPGRKGVSWEGHLFGAISGALLGFLMAQTDLLLSV